MPREDYTADIGLEVHAQLKTRSKMFCACAVEYGADPNTRTCPVCLGLPGSLPVLNEGAIRRTVLAGLMLGCKIAPVSKWDRKNYFYPDMPKNYQISQYDLPLCEGGGVPLYDHAYPKDAQNDIAEPGKLVGLTRIHLEEDVAKSFHFETTSGIDFNRAGTPLMEIVSEPEIASPEEAFAYLTSLRQILIYGDIGDADMEKGQLRCDVNVSVRRKGAAELGAKVELKNLNSISGVRRSLAYEIGRQIEALENGEAIHQQTRRWDDDLGETTLMRTKESAHDYRYFPDPDLMPVETAGMIEDARSRVPELPHEKAARFERDYGLNRYNANVLSSGRALADYYEEAARVSKKPDALSNWVINDLLRALNEASLGIEDCPVPAGHLADLTNLIANGEINGKQAKEIFEEVFSTGKSPSAVKEEKGIVQIDSGAVEALCERVIGENPKPADDYRGGNDKSINFLKGQVMKLSRGQANPAAVGDILDKLLRG